MKKYVLSFMAVALAIVLYASTPGAFQSKHNSSLFLKKYVGVACANGRYYLQDNPHDPGNPYQIPFGWQEGEEFDCLIGDFNEICIVIVPHYTYPIYDFNIGCYYFEEEDVTDREEGIFFVIQ